MKYYKYLLPFKPDKPTNSYFTYVGKEVVEPPTYDEEGNLLTETVYGSGYKVDVMWKGEPNPEWNQYIVKPSNHEHWFAGQQKLWEKCNP